MKDQLISIFLTHLHYDSVGVEISFKADGKSGQPLHDPLTIQEEENFNIFLLARLEKFVSNVAQIFQR